MSIRYWFRVVSVMVLISMLWGMVGSAPVAVQAAPSSSQPPIANAAYWDRLLGALSTATSAQDPWESAPQNRRHQTGLPVPVWESLQSLDLTLLPAEPVPTNYSLNAMLSGESDEETPALLPDVPWPSAKEGAVLPQAPVSIQPLPVLRRIAANNFFHPLPKLHEDGSYQVFLPLILKDAGAPDYQIITPAGGMLTAVEFQATVIFAPQGLPATLRAAIVPAVAGPTSLPLQLYPLGQPFSVDAYWFTDNRL